METDADDDAPDSRQLSYALFAAYRRLTSDQLQRVHHKYVLLLAKIKLRGPDKDMAKLVHTTQIHLRVINELLARRNSESRAQ